MCVCSLLGLRLQINSPLWEAEPNRIYKQTPQSSDFLLEPALRSPARRSEGRNRETGIYIFPGLNSCRAAMEPGARVTAPLKVPVTTCPSPSCMWCKLPLLLAALVLLSSFLFSFFIERNMHYPNLSNLFTDRLLTHICSPKMFTFRSLKK